MGSWGGGTGAVAKVGEGDASNSSGCQVKATKAGLYVPRVLTLHIEQFSCLKL